MPLGLGFCPALLDPGSPYRGSVFVLCCLSLLSMFFFFFFLVALAHFTSAHETEFLISCHGFPFGAQHFALVYPALTLPEFYLFSKISFGTRHSAHMNVTHAAGRTPPFPRRVILGDLQSSRVIEFTLYFA